MEYFFTIKQLPAKQGRLPQYRYVIHVHLGGGKLKEVEVGEPTSKTYASANGYTRIDEIYEDIEERKRKYHEYNEAVKAARNKD